MEEKSVKKNHGGGIKEQDFFEAFGKHLGSIWEAFGKHLGSIWEASERHLGGIWGASGTPGGHGASGGSWKQLLQYLSAKMQKFL